MALPAKSLFAELQVSKRHWCHLLSPHLIWATRKKSMNSYLAGWWRPWEAGQRVPGTNLRRRARPRGRPRSVSPLESWEHKIGEARSICSLTVSYFQVVPFDIRVRWQIHNHTCISTMFLVELHFLMNQRSNQAKISPNQRLIVFTLSFKKAYLIEHEQNELRTVGTQR